VIATWATKKNESRGEEGSRGKRKSSGVKNLSPTSKERRITFTRTRGEGYKRRSCPVGDQKEDVRMKKDIHVGQDEGTLFAVKREARAQKELREEKLTEKRPVPRHWVAGKKEDVPTPVKAVFREGRRGGTRNS